MSNLMRKENRFGKQQSYRFDTLRVSSKTTPLLSLEELFEIEKQQQEGNNVGEGAQKLELTPLPTSFHSGCLVYSPYNQLVIVGGCFDDEDDDEFEEDEDCKSNAVMAFNFMESKWELLHNQILPSEQDEGEQCDESKISQNVNISSDEQYLERIVQSPMVGRSSEQNSIRTNIPPRIWGHSCSYCPITRCAYIFGGIDYDDNYNENLYAFSLEDRKWRRIQPQKDDSLTEFPSGRQGHRTVYVPSTQKIILFGGFSNSHLDDFLEYDVKNNMWSKVEEDPAFKENRPSTREVLSMVYAENRNSVLVFGGKIEDERYSDLREYSFTTKKWSLLHLGQSKLDKKSTPTTTKTTVTQLKDEPSPRSSHTAIYLESYQKMIIFSGYDGVEWFSDCYEFDFNTMRWSSIKLLTDELPESEREFYVNGFSSHVTEFNKITNEILIFGGWDGTVDSNILFSIRIPSFNVAAMRAKLYDMDDLFSDVSIKCTNNSDEN